MLRNGGLKLFAAAAFLFAAPAAKAALIGVSTATSGIYSIDPATGAATLLSTLDGVSSIAGASYLGGQLYVSDVFTGGAFSTVAADPATGAVTVISDQEGSTTWAGLASSEADGVLYTVDALDGNRLKAITPGGVVTAIGAGLNIFVAGMAYDDLNGILYAATSQSLYAIDTATGDAALIGALGFNSPLMGLAYDEDTQTLYANAGNLGALFVLDVATGLGTLVGLNGAPLIDGLAWVSDAAIPAPAALPLFLAGAAGLGFARRRRK